MKAIFFSLYILIFNSCFAQEVIFKLQENRKSVTFNDSSKTDILITFKNKDIYSLRNSNASEKYLFVDYKNNLDKIELLYHNQKYIIAENLFLDTNKIYQKYIVAGLMPGLDFLKELVESKTISISIDKYPFSNPKSDTLIKNHFDNSIRKDEIWILYINKGWSFIIPNFDINLETDKFIENIKSEFCDCLRKKLKTETIDREIFNKKFHECLDPDSDMLVARMYTSYTLYFNNDQLKQNNEIHLFNEEIKLFLQKLDEYSNKNCLK